MVTHAHNLNSLFALHGSAICGEQWRNRRGGAGPGNFCWPTGKKEARKKGKRGENWEEKKENCKREGGKLKRLKREGEILKMEGGKVKKWTKWRDDLFFFFFACHFSKPLKFGLCLQKRKFSTRKKHFTLGKKIRKNDFAPSEKFSCYAPGGESLDRAALWMKTFPNRLIMVLFLLLKTTDLVIGEYVVL